jgi:hypothetical protein
MVKYQLPEKTIGMKIEHGSMSRGADFAHMK